MNFVFSILIAIIIILLFAILAAVFSAWLDRKDKEEFIEKTADKVSSLIDSKLELMTDQSEAGPWYLVVYTQDSNYPIWISNNTIRSVHPDPEHCKITINQFNGEYMVIENVISYDMRSANKLFDYEM
ncbi:MAG: hypothetical protein MSS52_10365 [Prevotella sp.]|nr:hypothetical protein [Prevotella sp.]